MLNSTPGWHDGNFFVFKANIFCFKDEEIPIKRRVFCKITTSKETCSNSTVTTITASDTTVSDFLKPIPLSSEMFHEIRAKQMVYVDKTDIIHKLLESTTKSIFIARPRKFGKSLLLDIICDILAGRKQLFSGLKIFDLKENWDRHAVFRLNFASNTDISIALRSAVDFVVREFKLNMAFEGRSDVFNDLLDYFERVRLNLKDLAIPMAVIVDEYDLPIVQYLEEDTVTDEQKNHLQNNSKLLQLLFNHIKNDIRGTISRFIVTGVAKFSKTSLFSAANQIQDYSFRREVSTLYGYTRLDIETYFKDHLSQLAKVKGVSTDLLITEIIKHYNGYCFSFDKQFTQTVLNPYDVNKLLSEQSEEFISYWIAEGQPRYFGSRPWVENIDLSNWLNTPITAEDFLKFDPEFVTTSKFLPAAFLTQVGLLTIRHINGRVVLDIPNEEVRSAFFFSLFKENRNIMMEHSKKCLRFIAQNKPDQFISQLRSFFACIPYSHSFRIAKYEAYYHTCLYLLMSLMGLEVASQEATNTGLIDLVVEQDSFIWVIELKLDKPAGVGLQQIEDKEYSKKYENLGKQILYFEINFDSKRRNIGSIDYVTLLPNEGWNTPAVDEEGDVIFSQNTNIGSSQMHANQVTNSKTLQRACGTLTIQESILLDKSNPKSWNPTQVAMVLSDTIDGVGLDEEELQHVKLKGRDLDFIVDALLSFNGDKEAKISHVANQPLEIGSPKIVLLLVRWVYNNLLQSIQ